MLRRHFLQSAALTIPTIGFAGRLYAAPASDLRLLLVFLRGAYDATNIVVPVSSDFYYASRPTLAIPRPEALPLERDWGLHPALKDSIYPLWQKGQIAFVPFAGTDDTSRSHFETQDTIELGQPVGGSRDYSSGFMNRLAGVLSGSKPGAFTETLPLCFRGAQPVPNVALAYTRKSGIPSKDTSLIESMYRDQALAAAVAQGFEVQTQVHDAFAGEMQKASRSATSPKGFELSAQRVGVLLQSQFNIGFVDVGGWDTHVNQGGKDGYLANRIGELGRGLARLADTLGPVWTKTVVIVVSEFGRTFRENGNRGTDHGHGSVYWVLGGAVKGGRVVGRQFALTEGSLFQNRDLPVLNDQRSLMGGIAQKLYGMTQKQLEHVFPNSHPEDLALI